MPPVDHRTKDDIDRAAEVATTAFHKIERHEAECAIRWAQARDTMERVEKKIEVLVGRWWSMATTIISLLTLALVSLIGKLTNLW